ncbi:MAG: hypothetical protein NTV23_00515 [Propionibacteriales bacterium]|nr:hypothetical protein [Propionibacteriales bacterium]
MHLDKNDIPTRIAIDGAIARQFQNFGEPEGTFGAEYFSLATGVDMAPLLAGLEDDLCQAPHWGYVIAGAVVVTYADGSTETCAEGSVFHWVAGHSVRVEHDAELILFSPQQEHGEVLDHIAAKLAGV